MKYSRRLFLVLLSIGFFIVLLIKETRFTSKHITLSQAAIDTMEQYPDYSYDGKLYDIKNTQFPHVSNYTYLDYTGSGLFQKRQIDSNSEDLLSNFYCNTHSASHCSHNSEEAIEEVRDRILSFFNVSRSTYSVIFTQGATAALHLVGDSFPWSNQSKYQYAYHNHNSVLGVRRLATSHGAEWGPLPWGLHEDFGDDIEPGLPRPTARDIGLRYPDQEDPTPHHLAAFPAECNLSGLKYPLDLIHRIESGELGQSQAPGHWHVLLDAAAYVPTNPLDLYSYPASFVVMSFYKLFGYPTGLGALLVRNDVAASMRKGFFGGGTVVLVSCEQDYCQLKPRYHERFEDGTLSFLAINSLRYGFDILEELGMQRIQNHVWAVTKRLYDGLSALTHSNGSPMYEVYGEHFREEPSRQGGIVAFNMMEPSGKYVGYNTLGNAAAEAGFMIRAGCSCNPGACHRFLHIDEERIIQLSLSRTSCGDEMDMVDGMPLGALRVSLGYPTTVEEVDAFLELAESFRDYHELKPLSLDDLF
eukprot:gnl/Dysnectes_brevis/2460_a2936_1480.p1 GENE.gnl/Dysnectes_brevis/2460_a2936_1480~~gnl/Dysnectes_brevis/2460_a2936_1480.p1  ORF type:complete len:529 (+),score=161.47 gnl/Dysnectes_brevis/2460_a2936_1480:125-1711(+)